jgi:hypothetical protein
MNKIKIYYLYNINDKKIEEYNEDEILEKLYDISIRVPTKSELEKTTDNKLKKIIKEYGVKEILDIIINSISTIENKVALYDAYSDNMYLINKENVYYRVVYHYYRFPEKKFYTSIEKKKKHLEKKIKSNIYDKKELILKNRKLRKYNLMLQFLDNFNIDILYNTYIRVYYLYANEVGKNITLCQRPSFIPYFTHIKPYYTRNEVINMALNMDIKFDKTNIDNLCLKIKDNDITAETLLNHQEYIIKQNKVGLIQYYTLHGSYIMNQYLRKMTNYPVQNTYLEKLIKEMWDLVIHSPSFDKDYILYRFINDDSYLRELEIGDIFSDEGFTSTTRDPFYKASDYKFGFILIKIKIPKNVKGVGLCIETLSHFPHEEEIILPPKTLLRLDKVDENCVYHNTDTKFMSKVKTKYEFTLIGKQEVIKFDKREPHINYDIVDFNLIDNVSTFSLIEKVNHFIRNHVDNLFQFQTKIGNKLFTIMVDQYDSTGAYKKFYAMATSNGFCLYTMYNNYILFFIELLEEKNKRYMHVNYYVKYSTIDRSKIISDEDFILFLSLVSNYFGIDYCVIYADYLTCDIFDKNINLSNRKINYLEHDNEINTIKQRSFSNKEKDLEQIETTDINKEYDYHIYGGNYCIEYYNYLKHNNKRYQELKILNIEIYPKFLYRQLDILKSTDPNVILNKEDKDELYQIYNKVYITLFDKKKYNIADLFIWTIENKCYLVELLLNKLNRLFKNENTLDKPYYILDTTTYLYNRRLITEYPQFVIDNSYDIDKSLLTLSKNEMRSRERERDNL